MKKFSFSMRNILNVNVTRREICEMELAEAIATLERETKQLEQIEMTIKNTRDPRKIMGNCTGEYLILRAKYLKLLNDRKKIQKRKIQQAEAEAQSCRVRLKNASIEVKKMEKAREKEFKAWDLAFKREEQKINDEIGNTRASRKALGIAV
jgi:flagellar export protein FliJ